MDVIGDTQRPARFNSDLLHGNSRMVTAQGHFMTRRIERKDAHTRAHSARSAANKITPLTPIAPIAEPRRGNEPHLWCKASFFMIHDDDAVLCHCRDVRGTAAAR